MSLRRSGVGSAPSLCMAGNVQNTPFNLDRQRSVICILDLVLFSFLVQEAGFYKR